MNDIFEDEEFVVVRCFCCSNWVRKSATRMVKTGEREDDERWCIGCIKNVDEFTISLEQPSENIEPFEPDL